jgi:N utilization substance protein A
MDVIVEEDQLSLAIGRRGQNVRLAAMLTGMRINILSKSKLQEKFKKATENLVQVDGVTEAWSQVLVQEGIMSVGDLSGLKVDELMDLIGVGQVEAENIVTNTLKAIEEGEVELAVEEDHDLVSASAVPAYKGLLNAEKDDEKSDKDKFSDAEKRLREELAAFKIK